MPRDGNAQCVASGNEFYVRFGNGDGMRRVYNVGDCDAVLCDYCEGSLACDGYYCPRHRGAEAFMDAKEPSYVYPYAFGNGDQFTFGVEIELESELSDDFVEDVTGSNIICRLEQGRVTRAERGGTAVQYSRRPHCNGL